MRMYIRWEHFMAWKHVIRKAADSAVTEQKLIT